jgi:hypothetical protein
MRPRVTQATLKRITKLDAPLREQRNRAAYVIALYAGIDTVNDSEREQFTRAQRTVLGWPPILDCDAWDAIAVPSQQKLIDASYEDREDRAKVHPEPVVTSKDDPADVSHRYRLR